jgi:hypothetical protein
VLSWRISSRVDLATSPWSINRLGGCGVYVDDALVVSPDTRSVGWRNPKSFCHGVFFARYCMASRPPRPGIASRTVALAGSQSEAGRVNAAVSIRFGTRCSSWGCWGGSASGEWPRRRTRSEPCHHSTRGLHAWQPRPTCIVRHTTPVRRGRSRPGCRPRTSRCIAPRTCPSVLRTPNLIRQVVEKPKRFGPGMK